MEPRKRSLNHSNYDHQILTKKIDDNLETMDMHSRVFHLVPDHPCVTLHTKFRILFIQFSFPRFKVLFPTATFAHLVYRLLHLL